MVGELRVSDRGPPAERPGRVGPQCVQRRVHRRVHARHEERCHRGDALHRLPRIQAALHPAQVRFHHLLVVGHREEERHVDVHPLGQQLGDGGEAGVGAGDLDHQVGPADRGPQPPRLGHGRAGVVGQLG